MPIERYFKLYLNAGRNVPQPINVNQYDQGEIWHFSLFTDNGEQYYPSAGAIIGIKSDGHVIDNSATVDSRGYVNVTETQQMTAAPGKAIFELSIDGNTHGTANFFVIVEPKPSEGGILSDSDLSLLQEAIDSTSPAAIAEGVSDWMDEHLTPTTPVVDDTLTVQGAAADAKKTGDEIADLKSAIAQSTGMSAEFKVALENLLSKVAYIDENGQTYVDALHTAMYPPANLVSISAVYTQSITVYDTDSLDVLRADLVVTANMSDETSETVTSYTLSGTLAEGTSEITVTYGGKTATFNVTVTEAQLIPDGYTQYDYLAIDATNGSSITSADYCILVPDISFSSDYLYEFSFYYPTTSDSAARNVIGARTGTSGSKLFGLFYTMSTHKLGYWLNGVDTVTAITNLTPDTVNTVKIKPVGSSETYPNNIVIESNGTEYNSTSTDSGITFCTYLGFFKYATSATTTNVSTSVYNGLRLGRLTVKNGETIVYDFIPVSNGTNYGYYERINSSFYTMTNPAKCIGGNWSA